MSSLAAARADNFYFPPEWTPQMGGISKFQGSKGANQYEQKGIIRFELPFDGWCLGCGVHMTKGLRFNAKKEKEGKYFTTQIWSFHMKCFSTSCTQKYKILTDPKNCTYDFAEGIRKHEQDFTPDVDDSLIVATSDETKQLIANDPMFRLQHNEEDRKRVLSAKEHLEALTELQDEHHKNYYDVNAMLRNKNRKRKKRDIELLGEAHAKGLSMPLVEPSLEDAKLAKTIVFKKRAIANGFAISEKQRMNVIQSQSIFERPAAAPDAATSAGKSAGPNNKSNRISNQLVVRTESNTAAPAKELSQYAKNTALLAKASALRIDPHNLKLSDPTIGHRSSKAVQDVGFGGAVTAKVTPSVVLSKKTSLSVDKVDSGKQEQSLLGMLDDYDD